LKRRTKSIKIKSVLLDILNNNNRKRFKNSEFDFRTYKPHTRRFKSCELYKGKRTRTYELYSSNNKSILGTYRPWPNNNKRRFRT